MKKKAEVLGSDIKRRDTVKEKKGEAVRVFFRVLVKGKKKGDC